VINLPPETQQDLQAQPVYQAQPTVSPEPELPGKLANLIESVNIAKNLDKERLGKIGRRCHDGYSVDEKSRQPWLTKVKRAIELANQDAGEKSFPWPGAANIKLPTILDACIKFAARAYSEIVKDGKVVKAAVVGDDPEHAKADRATRVADYMSWQLTEKEQEWETDTDKLLHSLPLVGHMFRKRYYCDNEKRSKSELCMPDSVCVNIEASTLESSRRFTHIIKNVSRNMIVGNQRAGVFRKIEIQSESGQKPDDAHDMLYTNDYYTLLEQYCWLDLDDDGFEEPYIVTIEEQSMQVLRIVARYDADGVTVNGQNEVMGIKPKSYFTEYTFIPAIDGTYYGIGFGQMLEPLTRAANTLVNQIADSGALNNMQAGYLSKEIKLKSGREQFELGEWKRTTASAEELKNGVFPLPTREPSPTLFNLLSLILDLTQDLASVKDVMSGDAPGQNVPATTVVALIEQGMKTFNAIYKRIYRSLKVEFKQLYMLNRDYMDEVEYFAVLDKQMQVSAEDFETESMDITPVADPVMSSDMQRLARAEALMGMIGMPGVNPRPIQIMQLNALKVPESDQAEILPEQDPNAIPPEIQALIDKAEEKMADIKLKEEELEINAQMKSQELEIKAYEAMGKVIKNIADAEGVEAGTQLSAYSQLSTEMLKIAELKTKQPPNAQGGQNVQNNSGNGLDTMEEQSGNQGLPPVPPISS